MLSNNSKLNFIQKNLHYWLTNMRLVFVFFLLFSSCQPSKHSEQSFTLIDAHSQANNLYKLRQYAQSLTAYQQAVKAYKAQQQWEKVWQCNNRIVQCHTQSAHFDKALVLAQKNLQLCQEKLDDRAQIQSYRASTQQLIANIFRKTFRYQEAVQVLQKVLAVYKKNTQKYFFEIAQVYNELGGLHLKKFAYAKAFEYHQKALGLLKGHLNPDNRATLRPLIAQTYNSIGMTYGEQGEFDTAIDYYQQALKLRVAIFGNTQHSDLAASYNNIGINYYLKGEYTPAQQYLQKAIKIRAAALGKHFHTMAGFYNNLAHVYLGKKEFEQSLKYFRWALDIRQEKQGAKSPLVAQSHIFLGNVYAQLNQPQKALEHYHRSLDINSKKTIQRFDQIKLDDFVHHRFLFEALGQLTALMQQQALAHLQPKNLEHTLAVIKNNIYLLDNYIRTLDNKKDKITFNEQLTLFCTQAIDILYELTKLNPAHKQRYQQAAFYFAERNKASVLSASLAEVNARNFANIPTNLLKQEQLLRRQIHWYDGKLLKATGKKKQEYSNTLFEKKRHYDQLIRSLERDYPKYYDLKYQRKVANISTVQKTLLPHEALLQYITGNTRSYVFVITKEAIQMVAIVPAKTLLPIVKSYYSTLQGGYPIKVLAKASYQTYQALIAPIATYIKPTSRLTIIPDWRLAKLPFGALISQLPTQPTPNDYSQLSYLIKNYEINYHYSASIWAKRQKICSTRPLDFVAFAPFSEGKGTVLTTRFMHNVALPASKVEVKSVLQMCKQQGWSAKAYLSQEASKASFLDKSPQARIIHIASHSVYDRNNEKLGRVYFSKSGTAQQNDNYLLAGSIYNLSLCADLVVLSSCESGLGKSYKGEGMMSLTRSFLYAGARNVVFSLWKVNDQYTKNLMVRFYQAVIQQKVNFAQALQQAKREIIASQKNLHPKDWSGFAIVGN
jgi:CHAT domain-containing protein